MIVIVQTTHRGFPIDIRVLDMPDKSVLDDCARLTKVLAADPTLGPIEISCDVGWCWVVNPDLSERLKVVARALLKKFGADL